MGVEGIEEQVCTGPETAAAATNKLVFLQQASATAAATAAAEAAATTKKLLFIQQALDTKASTVLAAVVFVRNMSSRQLRILSPHHHRMLLPPVAAHSVWGWRNHCCVRC